MKVKYKNNPINEFQPLTKESYRPSGTTALNDAIGDTIRSLESESKDHPEVAVLLVVMTDGFENASRRFTTSQIKELIQSKEKAEEWSFVYLGANQDAFAVSSNLGFAEKNTLNFTTDNIGDLQPMMMGMAVNYSAARSQGVGATKKKRKIYRESDLSADLLLRNAGHINTNDSTSDPIVTTDTTTSTTDNSNQ